MRLLIFILLFPFIASSQVIMTARYTAKATTASCTYLIDCYSGSTMAYSLRKLSNSYAGNCIKIRRSSDNTEQDIGFVSDYVDTASMKTFVSSNSAYVVTFYDQSGNGYNATNATAANQPRIMNAGAIEYQNSKVTMYFDGSNDGLKASSVKLNTYTTLFSVVKTTTAKPMFFEHSPNVNTYDGFFFYGSDKSSWFFRRTGSHGAVGVNSWLGSNIAVTSLIYNGSGGAYYKNGSIQSNGSVSGYVLSNTTVTDEFNLFSRNGTSVFSDGYLSEFVLWSSDKSSDRAAIELNIKTYYSVY